jgi:hypothetical protein
MKFTALAAPLLLAAAAAPVAVLAQDVSAQLVVGAMVYGPGGNEVGKIEQVAGGNVVLNTGLHSATLPASSFARGAKGAMIGYTKEQLDAAIDQAEKDAAAQLAAAMVPGAKVSGADGIEVGSVKAVNADGSVVLTHEGADIALPKDQFMVGASGLSLVFTSAQLKAALKPDAEASAALDSALVAGASLVTADGMPAGKIREIDASGNAVVDHDSKSFALPKDQFTVDGEGRLALRFTDAQLKAALGGS